MKFFGTQNQTLASSWTSSFSKKLKRMLNSAFWADYFPCIFKHGRKKKKTIFQLLPSSKVFFLKNYHLQWIQALFFQSFVPSEGFCLVSKDALSWKLNPKFSSMYLKNQTCFYLHLFSKLFSWKSMVRLRPRSTIWNKLRVWMAWKFHGFDEIVQWLFCEE